MTSKAETAKVRWITILAGVSAGLCFSVGFAAVALAGIDLQSFASNRSRLERMSREQRRQIWEKHETFLALPEEEQERIRRLHAELQKLPNDKRGKYKTIMDRYKKWQDMLSLVHRQMLEDAAIKGSSALYEMFKEVKDRQKEQDSKRPYWLLPDRAVVRAKVPKILAKLSPEEVEQLDQTPPLDRGEKLLAHAQQLGMESPTAAKPGRLRKGPYPPVDQEKLRAFIRKLSRDQLEAVSDLGQKRPIQSQRLLELYYERHPEELAERLKRGEGTANPGKSPEGASPKSPTPPDGAASGRPERKDRPGQPGKPSTEPPDS